MLPHFSFSSIPPPLFCICIRKFVFYSINLLKIILYLLTLNKKKSCKFNALASGSHVICILGHVFLHTKMHKRDLEIFLIYVGRCVGFYYLGPLNLRLFFMVRQKIVSVIAILCYYGFRKTQSCQTGLGRSCHQP